MRAKELPRQEAQQRRNPQDRPEAREQLAQKEGGHRGGRRRCEDVEADLRLTLVYFIHSKAELEISR